MMCRLTQHTGSSKRCALHFTVRNILYPLSFVLFTSFFLLTAHFKFAVVNSPRRLSAHSVSQDNNLAAASAILSKVS